MEQSTQTDFIELSKDIYAKLDTIQSVLGIILQKTNLITEPVKIYTIKEKTKLPPPVEKIKYILETDDNLDARDFNGSVLPLN